MKWSQNEPFLFKTDQTWSARDAPTSIYGTPGFVKSWENMQKPAIIDCLNELKTMVNKPKFLKIDESKELLANIARDGNERAADRRGAIMDNARLSGYLDDPQNTESVKLLAEILKDYAQNPKKDTVNLHDVDSVNSEKLAPKISQLN